MARRKNSVIARSTAGNAAASGKNAARIDRLRALVRAAYSDDGAGGAGKGPAAGGSHKRKAGDGAGAGAGEGTGASAGAHVAEDPATHDQAEDGGWFFARAVKGCREYMEDAFKVLALRTAGVSGPAPSSSSSSSSLSAAAAAAAGAGETGSSRASAAAAAPTVCSESSAAGEGGAAPAPGPAPGPVPGPGAENISFFGVFDGHGGSLCSKYCKSELFDIIREQASFPQDMSRALIDGFSSIDTIVCELSEEAIDFQDGTTATVVVVDHAARQLWVAHVGDTRCILVRKDGTTLPLTRDHSCALKDECRRIRDVGGFVVQCGDIGRVLGVLAVTRAIGDALLKPSVTAVPEVRRVDLSGEDGDTFGFVCIGSDGIWDEVSNDEAGRIVAAKGVRRAANDITKLALDRGSEDNLTFLAVDISREAAVTVSPADPDASPEGTGVLADSAQQQQQQQDNTALKRRRKGTA